MKIAILDNDTPEWLTQKGAGLLTKVTPKVAKATAAPDGTQLIGSRIFSPGADPYYSHGSISSPLQTEFHLMELNTDNRDEVKRALLSLRPDLLLIDCSINEKDDYNEDGIDFAIDLVASKMVTDDQIIIATNKKNTEKIQNEDIPKFRKRFLPALKDDAQGLAKLITQRLAAPSRPTIDLADAVNDAIHKTGETIERFFHGRKKTKQNLIDACDQLIKATGSLEEPKWLKAVIEHFTRNNQPLEEVASDLCQYVKTANLRAVMTTESPSQELVQLIEIAATFTDDPKLKDLLFPRIDCRTTAPFRLYCKAKCSEFGFSVDWDKKISDDVLANPDTSPNIEGGVPLSWFLSFDREWLGDLGKCLADANAGKELYASCGSTKAPHHRFVVFWNKSLGFPDKNTLLECAGKALLEASKFSHVLIASACSNGTKALVEVLPTGQPRDIPSCRMHFGQTLFDFSRWSEGSAYLFAVRGLRN